MPSLISLITVSVLLGLCYSEIYSPEERKKMLKAADEIPDEEKWKVTKTCFMELEVDDKPHGRIEIALFGEVAPITVGNFAALCKGNYNKDPKFGYQGTSFHRLVQDFVLQGGDFTKFDGTGGKSIYGPTMADEPIVHRHSGPGFVSMAHLLKPNSASSQFFINIVKAKWLDGHHVVFGKVIKGMDLIEKINENVASDPKTQVPLKEVVIVESGLEKHQPYVLEESLRN
jgi:cyclophilin family peptidyl-prolyl cis-trans isomerase